MAGNKVRGFVANVLTTAAVLLLVWWLFRRVISFVFGLVTFIVLIGVVILLFSLAHRVRGKR
jgi:hypothetical protein